MSKRNNNLDLQAVDKKENKNASRVFVRKKSGKVMRESISNEISDLIEKQREVLTKIKQLISKVEA